MGPERFEPKWPRSGAHAFKNQNIVFLFRACIQVFALQRTSLNFPGGSDSKESAYSVGDPVQSLGQEDPLEKEMATHSSILAWKIPWTEEPGGLQFMGLQRIGHD